MVEIDYLKYRGKCKVMCEELMAKDDSLKLVRGHYLCPFWGEQTHWWCVGKTGKIIDPTKLQFPSKGTEEYLEFNGMVQCAECGKEIKEEDADIEGNYAFCSYNCLWEYFSIMKQIKTAIYYDVLILVRNYRGYPHIAVGKYCSRDEGEYDEELDVLFCWFGLPIDCFWNLKFVGWL